jgi:hypothetical protein
VKPMWHHRGGCGLIDKLRRESHLPPSRCPSVRQTDARVDCRAELQPRSMLVVCPVACQHRDASLSECFQNDIVCCKSGGMYVCACSHFAAGLVRPPGTTDRQKPNQNVSARSWHNGRVRPPRPHRVVKGRLPARRRACRTAIRRLANCHAQSKVVMENRQKLLSVHSGLDWPPPCSGLARPAPRVAYLAACPSDIPPVRVA